MKILEGKNVPIKSWCNNPEEGALEQARNLAKLPFIFKQVNLMPDTHTGYGMPIGGVIATKGVVIPNAVGVDIGCGMCAMKTSLTDITTFQLKKILGGSKEYQGGIRSSIPVGRNHHSKKQNETLMPIPTAYCDGVLPSSVDYPIVYIEYNSALKQLGTLGSGNHFIEIQQEIKGNIWVMIHSGSRNLGYKVAKHYNKLAQELCKKWYSNIPEFKGEDGLAFLPLDTKEGQDYLREMNYCLAFAYANRKLMLERVKEAFLDVVDCKFETEINIHHNYAVLENHFGHNVVIHRKGATSAREGQLGIIPGCFVNGTRVLLANGFYKNIENLNKGEEIVNKEGEITRVKSVFKRGIKSVMKYKNNTFNKYTLATLEHEHYICDFSSTANRQQISMKTVSDKQDNKGNSKYKWEQLKHLTKEKSVLLLPKKINFRIPITFSLNLLGKKINPNYNIGYLFGLFLGDGNTYYSKKKGGSVSWYFGIDENKIADKLIHILKFFKLKPTIKKSNIIFIRVSSSPLSLFFGKFKSKKEKCLPQNLWCKNFKYLKGLYDGLIDSDGHVNNKTKKLTNTSSLLIEQFGTIHYLLFGYYPSVSIREPTAGNLTNCNIKNVKPSFRSSSLLNPILSKKYQLIPIYEIYHNEIKEMETYDIETSDITHSFIANNSIVHNSQGTASYIVKGKGNLESFMSCSHGAGRKMSRTKARETLNLDDEIKKLDEQGILHAIRNKSNLDEASSAYKNIFEVMEEQKDLVDIVVKLKPLAVVKG